MGRFSKSVSFLDWNTGSSTALPMYPLSRTPSLRPIEFDPAVLIWTYLVLTTVPCPGCTTGPHPELQELPVWPWTCPISTGFCTVVWPSENFLKSSFKVLLLMQPRIIVLGHRRSEGNRFEKKQEGGTEIGKGSRAGRIINEHVSLSDRWELSLGYSGMHSQHCAGTRRH